MMGSACPPLCPFVWAIMTYYVFRRHRIFGGSLCGRGESPVVRSGFLNISYEIRSIQIWCGNCYHYIHQLQ